MWREPEDGEWYHSAILAMDGNTTQNTRKRPKAHYEAEGCPELPMSVEDHPVVQHIKLMICLLSKKNLQECSISEEGDKHHLEIMETGNSQPIPYKC